ncbi:MAG: FAD-dependent oxidoreductase [Streptosporangiales bacterium]|nr:FAD-dependent oxidoreductase [Streptosporangiales bacterium]
MRVCHGTVRLVALTGPLWSRLSWYYKIDLVGEATANLDLDHAGGDRHHDPAARRISTLRRTGRFAGARCDAHFGRRLMTSDPIVVGAGPVGLTAAWLLASRGIAVTVLEAAPEPQTDWRASTFHAATLELLDQLGVVDDMHSEGLAVPRYQFRDRTEGVVAEFEFGVLADVTRFPYRLQLNQQRLVAMLLERLARSPQADLRFGHEVTDVTNEGDGAVVQVEVDGRTESIAGSFVLAADGASSIVRRQLEIPFDGMTYPQRFIIISMAEDLRADCVPDLADVSYISDPKEFLFALRTPDSWRTLFPVPMDEPVEVATSEKRMQERLAGFHPLGRPYQILDRQIYNVHQRVAGAFRAGRVLLLGDAAHINSPLGGMGLNSGIHDAMDAGLRLVRVLSGDTDRVDEELDTYARARRTVAIDYVRADTHRNTTIMAESDPAVRAANHARLRATAADPKAAREWMLRASMIAQVHDQRIGAA